MKKTSMVLLLALFTLTVGGLTFQAATKTADVATTSDNMAAIDNRRHQNNWHDEDCLHTENDVDCPYYMDRHADCLNESGEYVHRSCRDAAGQQTASVQNNNNNAQNTNRAEQNNTAQTGRGYGNGHHNNGNGRGHGNCHNN